MIGLIDSLPHWALQAVSTGGTTEEPVSNADALATLRLESSSTEELTGYIAAARLKLEKRSRRAFLRQQFDYAVDRIPLDGILKLPLAPLVSVESITGYDVDGTPTVMSSSEYVVDTLSEPGRVALNQGASWPSNLRDTNGLIVRFTAGYSTGAAGVPMPIIEALKQLLVTMYEHRGEGVGEIPVPPLVDFLLEDFVLEDVA